MKKIKTFFKTLYFSFTDPNYYRDVAAANIKFSLKYFLTFYLFIALLFSIYGGFVINEQVRPNIDGFVDEVADLYPQDLIVYFDGEENKLSTKGVEEPIVIPMIESGYVETDIKNLLVIDTAASAEDISDYATAILLTDTHLTTLSDVSGGFQMFPFTEMFEGVNENDEGYEIVNVTLDKSFIDSNKPYMKVMLHKAANIMPFVIFAGSLMFFYVSRLMMLVFLSMINFVSASLLGRKLSYAKSYQVGLHTITVADGITKLSSLVFENVVPSLFSFAFLGISFIALLGLKKKSK